MIRRMCVSRCCCSGCDDTFTDDFSTSKTGWTLFSTSVASGRLTASNVGAAWGERCGNLPALNGLVATVEAKVYNPGSSATCGVAISTFAQSTSPAPTLLFIARWGFGDFGLSYPSGFASFGGAPSAGDALKLVVSDTSSGAGTYKAECYVNNVLQHTQTGISISFTDPMYHSVRATRSGFGTGIGEWDDYSFSIA